MGGWSGHVRRQGTVAVPVLAAAMALAGAAAGWQLAETDTGLALRNDLGALTVDFSCSGQDPGVIRFALTGRDFGAVSGVTVHFRHTDGSSGSHDVAVTADGDGLHGRLPLTEAMLSELRSGARMVVVVGGEQVTIVRNMVAGGLAREVVREFCGI